MPFLLLLVFIISQIHIFANSNLGESAENKQSEPCAITAEEMRMPQDLLRELMAKRGQKVISISIEYLGGSESEYFSFSTFRKAISSGIKAITENNPCFVNLNMDSAILKKLEIKDWYDFFDKSLPDIKIQISPGIKYNTQGVIKQDEYFLKVNIQKKLSREEFLKILPHLKKFDKDAFYKPYSNFEFNKVAHDHKYDWMGFQLNALDIVKSIAEQREPLIQRKDYSQSQFGVVVDHTVIKDKKSNRAGIFARSATITMRHGRDETTKVTYFDGQVEFCEIQRKLGLTEQLLGHKPQAVAQICSLNVSVLPIQYDKGRWTLRTELLKKKIESNASFKFEKTSFLRTFFGFRILNTKEINLNILVGVNLLQNTTIKNEFEQNLVKLKTLDAFEYSLRVEASYNSAQWALNFFAQVNTYSPQKNSSVTYQAPGTSYEAGVEFIYNLGDVFLIIGASSTRYQSTQKFQLAPLNYPEELGKSALEYLNSGHNREIKNDTIYFKVTKPVEW